MIYFTYLAFIYTRNSEYPDFNGQAIDSKNQQMTSLPYAVKGFFNKRDFSGKQSAYDKIKKKLIRK